jgi:hypothetical protein
LASPEIEALLEALRTDRVVPVTVFDYILEGGEAEHAAYLANTPESEQAELIVVMTDPRKGLRGGEPYQSRPALGDGAHLADSQKAD